MVYVWKHGNDVEFLSKNRRVPGQQMKREVALATFQKDVWGEIVSASSGLGDLPMLAA